MEQNDIYSRPAAQFEDGTLVVRPTAAKGCRRMLWYTATGGEPSNPPTSSALMVMEAGTALEPVVLRAMERAGWAVTPADPEEPGEVSLHIGPKMKIVGHPDATAVISLADRTESIVEVKTRGTGHRDRGGDTLRRT